MSISAEAFKTLDGTQWMNIITTLIKTAINSSSKMLCTQEPPLPRVQVSEAMGINAINLSRL